MFNRSMGNDLDDLDCQIQTPLGLDLVCHVGAMAGLAPSWALMSNQAAHHHPWERLHEGRYLCRKCQLVISHEAGYLWEQFSANSSRNVWVFLPGIIWNHYQLRSN